VHDEEQAHVAAADREIRITGNALRPHAGPCGPIEKELAPEAAHNRQLEAREKESLDQRVHAALS
jgi:hypothetical protein